MKHPVRSNRRNKCRSFSLEASLTRNSATMKSRPNDNATDVHLVQNVMELKFRSHFAKNPKVSVQGAHLRDLYNMNLWT